MKSILTCLISASLALGQVTSPEAPKPIVSDYAKKVKADPASSSCEKACAEIAEGIPKAFYLRTEVWLSKTLAIRQF